jgi:iron(III) transport system substrate-binding protein
VKSRFFVATIIVSLVLALGCVGFTLSFNKGTDNDVIDYEQLNIYSSHAVEFLSPIIAEFESRTGIRVNIKTGRTDDLLSKIEKRQNTDDVDIMWGGSLSVLRPYMNQFEEYSSVNEPYVCDEYNNVEGMLTRFVDVPSVIIVNLDLVGDVEIKGYEDLLNPKLRGKIAFCTSSASSSYHDHLINMLYAMGKGKPENGWGYVVDFCRNLNGQLYSASAVYQGVADGEFVAGLTFEEAAAKLLSEGENIEIVYMKEGVLSAPECICLVKDAPNMENGKAFIDFVTGYDAQRLIAQNLNRRSVRRDVEHSKYLIDKEKINIIYSDSELVSSMNDEWVQHFMRIYSENIDNYNWID